MQNDANFFALSSGRISAATAEVLEVVSRDDSEWKVLLRERPRDVYRGVLMRKRRRLFSARLKAISRTKEVDRFHLLIIPL